MGKGLDGYGGGERWSTDVWAQVSGYRADANDAQTASLAPLNRKRRGAPALSVGRPAMNAEGRFHRDGPSHVQVQLSHLI